MARKKITAPAPIRQLTPDDILRLRTLRNAKTRSGAEVTETLNLLIDLVLSQHVPAPTVAPPPTAG